MNQKQQNHKHSVDLHIEELVLHGFRPQDRYRIALAVEQELTQLLSEGDIPSSLVQGGVIPEIDCGDFLMRRGTTPESIGEQVSQNIYGGLNR